MPLQPALKSLNPSSAASAKAKASPAAKPAAAAPQGKAGYAAQKQAHKPALAPIHATGATLINNHPAKEQGKPSGSPDKKPSSRPHGQFLVKGQAFGSLDEVQVWLEATRPQDPELVIQVTPGGLVHVGAQTLWYYYNPQQKIVLDGQGGEVSGLHNKRPTQGYFLSYRPAVGEGTTAKNPAAANLEVKNLSIRGFEAGGIEISPQKVAGKDNQWAGGIEAFVGGASIHDVGFKDLGNKGTARKDRVWNNMRFGAGGVTMRGVQNSTVEDCHFENLTNGQMTFNGQDKDGKPTSREGSGNHLFHGVYLRDGSSGNTVRHNQFDDVGGDVVRVSNASNNNVIAGNTTHNAGVHGLVSNWFNSAKNPPELDSTGTVIKNNKIGTVHGSGKQGGKKQGAAYNRHESKGNQAAVTV